MKTPHDSTQPPNHFTDFVTSQCIRICQNFAKKTAIGCAHLICEFYKLGENFTHASL